MDRSIRSLRTGENESLDPSEHAHWQVTADGKKAGNDFRSFERLSQRFDSAIRLLWRVVTRLLDCANEGAKYAAGDNLEAKFTHIGDDRRSDARLC
ncbi:hypothetical protein ABEV74_15970 [Paenibacillus cisolokensis]|uniref:hypothetical protein n=1 Tax=Paenibacillus cisolokensis TaxID=1658519 RepID=UPI003D2D1B04